MTSDARLVVGSVTVDIGSHQWDFIDGAVYLQRFLGLTPYGRMWRERYNIKVRTRTVRFAKSYDLMQSLRRLAIVAATTATPVTFYPDVSDLGTSWIVDWPQQTTFSTVIDNRLELRVALAEQSTGA